MSQMRVALFEDPAQAEPTRQHLVQAGICAEIHKESRLAKLWFVPKRQTGLRLEVPTKDAERARRLLVQWDSQCGWLKGAVHCPECNSTRIEYPQFTEKSLLTNLAMGLMAELRLVEREYYCEDCHYMWVKSDANPRRVRKHMAPNYFLEVFGQSTPLETSKGRAKPIFARVQSGLKVPSRKKCPAAPSRPTVRIFKLWRRILGVTLAVSVTWLVLDSHSTLIESEAAGGTTKDQVPGPTPKRQANRLTILNPQESVANPQAPTYLRDVLPILIGKCARCHNEQTRLLQDWLDYRTAFADRRELERRVWDSWRGTYFKQQMPVAYGPESLAMTEEERRTIRDWVKSGAALGVKPEFNNALSKEEKNAHGRQLFTTICAACHQPTGQGIPGRFPPLAGSDFLNSDKHRAIKVLINGLQGEVTVNGQRFNNSMPKFPLGDEDIASALTYVYNSFGNSRQEVTPAEVSAARLEAPELNLAEHNQGTRRTQEEKSAFE